MWITLFVRGLTVGIEDAGLWAASRSSDIIGPTA
jgi:hypothetical protein